MEMKLLKKILFGNTMSFSSSSSLSSSTSSSSTSSSSSSSSSSLRFLESYDIWNVFDLEEFYHGKAPDAWNSFVMGGVSLCYRCYLDIGMIDQRIELLLTLSLDG
jgi:hypothetical protein